MTEQQNWPADVVERGAEALWQAESLRAADRQRLIAWGDTDERTKEAWRFMYRAAISALPAAARAVIMGEAVAVPRNVETDAPEMLEEMRRAMRAVRLSGVCGMSIDAQWRYEYARESAGYRAMLAASPWAQEPQR